MLDRPDGFVSWKTPPSLFAYDIPARKKSAWQRGTRAWRSTNIEVRRVGFKSVDGTEVPMCLAAQKRIAGPRPVFLTGYGGYGITVTPQFNAYSSFLVEQGFLLAIPMVRGGGELGEAWHLAGKRQNRQSAIDDFTSAAEWLVTNNYAAVGKIAAGGGPSD